MMFYFTKGSSKRINAYCSNKCSKNKLFVPHQETARIPFLNTRWKIIIMSFVLCTSL